MASLLSVILYALVFLLLYKSLQITLYDYYEQTSEASSEVTFLQQLIVSAKYCSKNQSVLRKQYLLMPQEIFLHFQDADKNFSGRLWMLHCIKTTT